MSQPLAATLRAIAAQLLSEAAQLEAPHPAAGGAVTAPANPAPFGAYADGQPKPAPAYDACRPMWEAAQREGAFDIHKFIGQGIQQGAAQMYSGHVTNWLAVEDALLELGRGAWGQAWLAHDVNAEMIHPHYLKLFLGYTVQRVYDKAGDLVRYDHKP